MVMIVVWGLGGATNPQLLIDFEKGESPSSPKQMY